MKVNIYVVTGANSGLGAALINALEKVPNSAVIRVGGPEWFQALRDTETPLPEHAVCGDLTDAMDSRRVSAFIKDETRKILKDFEARSILDEPEGHYTAYPVLINCAGINYIDWFENAEFYHFDALMDLNVKAGLMLTQNLIGPRPPFDDHDTENWFRGTGAIVNIVSNASHVPMTNSVFYNASKGAFHIATLALARELRKTHGICIFGVSPNKLSGTGMSGYIENRVPALRGWTPEQAAQYQLGALPAGEETDPAELADFLAYLLSTPRRHKFLTNTILPYGA